MDASICALVGGFIVAIFTPRFLRSSVWGAGDHELVKAAENRHKMYNSELKYIQSAEQEGRAFVIAPPEALPVGHVEHDPDVMREVYRIGRRTAERCLDQLKAFLEEESNG